MTAVLTELETYPNFSADDFAAGSDALSAKRQAAFDLYASLPAPTDRTEEYRRTPPRLLKLGNFARIADLQPVAAGPAHDWDEDYDVVVSVSEAGYCIQGAVDGLTVCPLADAPASDLETFLQGDASPETPRKMRALNSAFFNLGLFIKVARGVEIERGVLVRYDLQSEAALLPRLLVVGEANSGLTITEVYRSGEQATQCIGQREVYADAAARIKVISVQDWGSKTIHIGEDWALARKDATVTFTSLTLGGKVSKLANGCDVCEEGANAYMGGLYFASNKQHFDQMTLQRHSAPNTYSNMMYKGAAKTKGYSLYQGIIRATRGSIGVDAYQTNNNLILDDTARVDSIPGLIINADELACSHGATMGNLDADQIFYLRARGLDEATARRLLVIGFFDEILEDRVPNEKIRDHVHQLIETKLNAGS